MKRGMDRRSVEEVKHAGIDEKSFRKGQSYVSLLYDLNASRVLEVMADRTTESAITLLSTLPEQRRNEIATVAVDMWVPFITVAGATLPNAAIVHDRFHIVSYLTNMIDEVRRKENKTLRAAVSMIWSGLAIHGYAIPTTGVKKIKPLFLAFNQKG